MSPISRRRCSDTAGDRTVTARLSYWGRDNLTGCNTIPNPTPGGPGGTTLQACRKLGREHHHRHYTGRSELGIRGPLK
eukprot:746122-Hanusia_phi.AAC.1